MTHGLLSGAFLPAEQVCVLRSLWHQRAMPPRSQGRDVQHMQKALTQMNIQLAQGKRHRAKNAPKFDLRTRLFNTCGVGLTRIDGELLFAFALTEPGAGTDAAAIETRAERHDGGWRLNGRKTWISDADRADYIIMPCRTGPRGGGKHGISMFLVPRSSAGLHMGVLPKAGHNCMPSWDVGVDDVLLWTWPSSMQRRAGSSGQRWEISRSSHLCWRTCYDPALTDRRWPALSQGVGAGAGEIDRS